MQEERKQILKMIEEGKLTADQALALLQELEKSQESMKQKEEALLNELSTVVKYEEGKKEEESYNYKVQSIKDKIIDFVDSAFKKIKDFDLDFNFGHAVDLSHVFQHGDAEIRNIDIDVANGSIHVIPWDQSDVRVECQAKVYRASTQDEARASFLKDTYFNIENGVLKFAAQPRWLKVDAIVYVPKTEYEKVRIRMFNGPIQSENLKAKTVKMKSANGKISASGLQGVKLEVETGNGKINVEKSRVAEVEAETINGAILLNGDFNRVEMQSFNGNVSCKLSGSLCEYIEAKAVTGSIDLSIPEGQAVNGVLKSNIGSFSVELDGIQIIEEKSEVVQKSLTFKPILSGQKQLKITADTKTGSIAVKKALM